MNARELSVLLVMCTIWGGHFVVIKLAVGEIPPLFYAAVRMALVAALLAPFLRWRHGQMLRVLMAGVCFGGLNYVFMFTGLYHATASAAALAIELYVPFATILSVLFLGERVGAKRIAGIALAFSGVAIIALGGGQGGQQGGDQSNITLGVTLISIAALFEAIGSVIVKKITGFKPIELLAWFAVVGAIVLWLSTAIFETNQMALARAGDPWLIGGAIAYSAIGGSIIGHTSYYWLLQRLPLSLLAPSILLTTLLAVLCAVIFLKEQLTWSVMVGGLMMLLGVGVVLMRTNRKPDARASLMQGKSGGKSDDSH